MPLPLGQEHLCCKQKSQASAVTPGFHLQGKEGNQESPARRMTAQANAVLRLLGQARPREGHGFLADCENFVGAVRRSHLIDAAPRNWFANRGRIFHDPLRKMGRPARSASEGKHKPEAPARGTPTRSASEGWSARSPDGKRGGRGPPQPLPKRRGGWASAPTAAATSPAP